MDIVKSIPFHFGIADGTGSSAARHTTTYPDPESSAGGFLILFFLSWAGCVDDVGQPLRNHVVQVLNVIGNALGVSMAYSLRDALATGIFGFGGIRVGQMVYDL